MPEKFDLDKEINRLLSTRETLAPWIFEPSGVMKEDVRQGLMDIARKIVLETVWGIEGLEVKDVCLTGSSSGYLYNDKSDIDIRIEVHNVNCQELAENGEDLDDFFADQKSSLFWRRYDTRFKGRRVDVKISSNQIDFLSLYSIKNNQWLIKPDKDYARGLNLEDVKAYYLKVKTDILAEFDRIQAEYSGSVLGDKIKDLYVRICHNEKNPKDFIVYKLLSRERVLKAIRERSVLADDEAFKGGMERSFLKL